MEALDLQEVHKYNISEITCNRICRYLFRISFPWEVVRVFIRFSKGNMTPKMVEGHSIQNREWVSQIASLWMSFFGLFVWNSIQHWKVMRFPIKYMQLSACLEKSDLAKRMQISSWNWVRTAPPDGVLCSPVLYSLPLLRFLQSCFSCQQACVSPLIPARIGRVKSPALGPHHVVPILVLPFAALRTWGQGL